MGAEDVRDERCVWADGGGGLKINIKKKDRRTDRQTDEESEWGEKKSGDKKAQSWGSRASAGHPSHSGMQCCLCHLVPSITALNAAPYLVEPASIPPLTSRTQ